MKGINTRYENSNLLIFSSNIIQNIIQKRETMMTMIVIYLVLLMNFNERGIRKYPRATI